MSKHMTKLKDKKHSVAHKMAKGLTKSARIIFNIDKGDKKNAHKDIDTKHHGGNAHNIRREEIIRERLFEARNRK